MNNQSSSKRPRSLRALVAAALALTLALTLLSACSKGEDSGAERRVLRVGTLYGSPSDESWFRQQYTDAYELTHPNIEVEIVSGIDWNKQRFNQPQKPGEQVKQPDPYEELKKMLTGERPVDVMVVEYSFLRRMVQDNLLKPLDPLIQQSKLDLSDYVPSVIEGIKSVGDNQIFALTPTFGSSALYYNKKLFQDAGVDLPTDGMMWDDVFALAERVSKGEGKDRKYGFAFNRGGWSDPFWDMNNYAGPLQLKIFDDKAEKMTVNTPEWEQVWTTVTNLYKKKIVPNGQDMQMDRPMDGNQKYNPFEGDLFLSGKVAMIVDGYWYLNELKIAKDNADKIEGFTMPDWDVVTVPQFPSKVGMGSNIYLNSLMGINQKAENPDDAWDFIQFMNSREWAKLKSRSSQELTARREFLKPIDGLTYNIEAFTKLKPIPPLSTDTEKMLRERPNLEQVRHLAQPLMQEVINGTKTVKEALAEWETKGDAMLQKIKTNPNGPLDPVEGGGVGGVIYGKG